jgi:hypothetical protein
VTCHIWVCFKCWLNMYMSTFSLKLTSGFCTACFCGDGWLAFCGEVDAFWKHEEKCYWVGFEVLTVVVMKSTIFWDITPCSPLRFNRCFGGTYRLHLQGQRIRQTRSQHESKWKAERILRPRRWRRYVPPKRQLTLNGLHGIISSSEMLLFTRLCCWKY